MMLDMAGGVVPFVDDAAEPAVRATRHAPAAPPRGEALVLAHGAGSDRDSPILVAVGEAFAARGFLVLRCDLPFRQARPHGPPPRESGPRDRAGLARAVRAARGLVSGRVFLGGYSYGGRQSSMLAAEEPTLAAALLLLAYPLHPPRRFQQQRTAHFAALSTPTLFVHGSRDPFGSVEALRAAVALVPARTSLVTVEGAGHALTTRRGGETLAALADMVSSAFLTLVG
jgi:predicted alpha/beta-hydrolase family hydrolase